MLSAEYRAKSCKPGEGEDETVGLYHYSLAEWFIQGHVFKYSFYLCGSGINFMRISGMPSKIDMHYRRPSLFFKAT